MAREKLKWHGERAVVGAAQAIPQVDYNGSQTLDLWLAEKEKRVYVTFRDWTQHPEPPEAKPGELYCGEITRRQFKLGDLELMVWQALDRRDRPWLYAKIEMFWVDQHPAPWRKRNDVLVPIPLYLPVTSKPWYAISKRIITMPHVDAQIKVYSASSTALKEFQKHPKKKELLFDVQGERILIRGHGYFGDVPGVLPGKQ